MEVQEPKEVMPPLGSSPTPGKPTSSPPPKKKFLKPPKGQPPKKTSATPFPMI
jgi:hypothetical protein